MTIQKRICSLFNEILIDSLSSVSRMPPRMMAFSEGHHFSGHSQRNHTLPNGLENGPHNRWVPALLTVGPRAGSQGSLQTGLYQHLHSELSSTAFRPHFIQVELPSLKITLSTLRTWPVPFWREQIEWPEIQGRWLWRKVKKGTCSMGDAGEDNKSLTGPVWFRRKPRIEGCPLRPAALQRPDQHLVCAGNAVFME